MPLKRAHVITASPPQRLSATSQFTHWRSSHNLAVCLRLASSCSHRGAKPALTQFIFLSLSMYFSSKVYPSGRIQACRVKFFTLADLDSTWVRHIRKVALIFFYLFRQIKAGRDGRTPPRSFLQDHARSSPIRNRY